MTELVLLPVNKKMKGGDVESTQINDLILDRPVLTVHVMKPPSTKDEYMEFIGKLGSDSELGKIDDSEGRTYTMYKLTKESKKELNNMKDRLAAVFKRLNVSFDFSLSS